MLLAAAGGAQEVVSPDGGRASARIEGGRILVTVEAGTVLDEIVLRSYAVGAAHMAFGWVTSEGLAVDADGAVGDLTIRSFGVPRAVDTPLIEVDVVDGQGPAVNGSDAVFTAVAAAVWLHKGTPERLPAGMGL